MQLLHCIKPNCDKKKIFLTKLFCCQHLMYIGGLVHLVIYKGLINAWFHEDSLTHSLAASDVAAELERELAADDKMPVVKKHREREYSGMFEYKKEEEPLLIRNLIIGEYNWVQRHVWVQGGAVRILISFGTVFKHFQYLDLSTTDVSTS